jgi:hypothetical protein
MMKWFGQGISHLRASYLKWQNGFNKEILQGYGNNKQHQILRKALNRLDKH